MVKFEVIVGNSHIAKYFRGREGALGGDKKTVKCKCYTQNWRTTHNYSIIHTHMYQSSTLGPQQGWFVTVDEGKKHQPKIKDEEF